MSKVIFMEESKHDLNNAGQFGDVVVLFPRSERRPTIYDPENYRKAVQRKLQAVGYDPERDYVALTGAAPVLFVMARALPQRFKYLIFDARDNSYSAAEWQ